MTENPLIRVPAYSLNATRLTHMKSTRLEDVPGSGASDGKHLFSGYQVDD